VTVAGVIYLLCALTSLVCAVLLLRGYRRSGVRLLLWSGLCFLGFFLNNVLLFIDVRVVPTIDLALLRMVPSLLGIALLLYGLIWETER
jgi:Family of unknown function (DUF5985)